MRTKGKLVEFTSCPNCGADVGEVENADGHCYHCGVDLPNITAESAGGSPAIVGELVAALESLTRHLDSVVARIERREIRFAPGVDCADLPGAGYALDQARALLERAKGVA